MKNFLFFASLFIFSCTGFAQNFQLQGQVTRNGSPLQNVNISVQKTQKGTITDSNGNYTLNLPQGTYTLVFSYGNSKGFPVTLNGDQTLNVEMGDAEELLDEVFLSALRVDADSPITYSNLTHKDIEERNLGQDIPVLMKYLPSVVTTSDAGAGVGYTGIRVRGSDPTRINVTINGVPYNDAESQGAFWVDLGDFASSVENLQLQRGVGTSTNGAGAFGASINIMTNRYRENPYAEIANSYGSFNTHKHTLKFSSGLFDKHWEFDGKASLIESDGYIDRASSKLKSYFLQGSYIGGNTIIKALTFGGTEKTYQAWYGISGDSLRTNRKFNPAGKYTDDDGKTQYYDNQTDNYAQDHYQLLWNQTYEKHWSSNIALHFTHGEGYYEEYHEDAALANYGLPNFMSDGKIRTTSDLVADEWLDNDFYGTTFSLNYQNSNVDAIFGGGWNRYEGDHYGDLVYTKFAKTPNKPFDHYYDNSATKTDFNVYAKATVSLTSKLAAYGDLQIRTIGYKTQGPLDSGIQFNIDDNLVFFNPKGGLTYQLNTANQFYFSLARAHREPSRADYKEAVNEASADSTSTTIKLPTDEKLSDFELGWRYKTKPVQVNANVYYMRYKDQLVLTGEIDDVGAFVRKNSGNSYRLGLELDATIQLSDKFAIRPNLALSQNKNLDFSGRVDGEQVNYGDTEISFSPSIVAGNMFRYQPVENLQLNLLSKFVGEQYMSNIEAEASKLDSYFTSGLNIQYTWQNALWFKQIVVTGLVNNIFDKKYVSNGFYDADYGAAYYPQAGINYLAGATLKF